MLGTDSRAFVVDSETYRRFTEYAELGEELHCFIYVGPRKDLSLTRPAANVFLYPIACGRLNYFLRAYRAVAKKLSLDTSSAWVITAQDPFETGIVATILSWRFKIPFQLQIHTDFLSPYFARESIKNRLRAIYGLYLARRASGLRVVSLRIKQSLINRGIMAEKIQVLPIMSRPTESKTKTSEKIIAELRGDHDLVFLIASRLTREKNISLAIRALSAAVFEKNPAKRNPLLLIVGSGPEDQELRATVTHYGIGKHCRFVPWADNLKPYYQASDVFLLTSNYEGYGRTIVEALEAGLPVITTDVGIAREMIVEGKNGHLIPIDDVYALGESIKNVLNRKTKWSINHGKNYEPFASRAEYLLQYKNALTEICHSRNSQS